MSPKEKEIKDDEEFKIELIDISDLAFDPQNPRLPRNFDSEDETEVLRWMLDDASLIELMGSIGEQGYFPGEPLLGYKKGAVTVVVEGNRRLAAAKLLLHPNSAPTRKKSVLEVSSAATNKPDKLPVIIYANREKISFLLRIPSRNRYKGMGSSCQGAISPRIIRAGTKKERAGQKIPISCEENW